MAQQLTIQAAATIRLEQLRRIEWWAETAAGPRHAFPVGDGYPQRAWCGARWTVRMGHAGIETCSDCLTVLRSAIKSGGFSPAEVAPETEGELREAWGK